jgi:protein involved in polysaccharide export with SLBB domain
MVNLLNLRLSSRVQRLATSTLLSTVALGLWLSVTGCGTPAYYSDLEHKGSAADALVLQEGDTVNIAFPGAPSFNTTQQIRRDGRITLTQVGEFKASGLTPEELQKELLKQYDAQLQTKEVSVTVQSAAFPVYIVGAVGKPGKMMFDRPTTPLEAIVEAGGFDYNRANLKKVILIRKENGKPQTVRLNLKNALSEGEKEPYYLRSGDIINVPEKFVWF